MNKGTLYGVGVGPGDPELLTIKAINILKSVDIIAVPKTKNEVKSTALSIVNNYIENKEILEIILPMSFDYNLLNESWIKASNTIISLLDNNKNIAFITLGDPTIYSTFMYLNKIIINLGYNTIIIPGITSFCACSAETGISLGENSQSIAIIPSASNIYELEKNIDNFNTIIVMKFRKNFDDIRNLLIKKNLHHNTIIVEKCTMKEQKIYRDIEKVDSEQLEYFSTMIINKGMI